MKAEILNGNKVKDKKFSAIAIAAHPDIADSIETANQIAEILEGRGVKIVHGSLTDAPLQESVNNNEIDLLIVLGGDGTVLRAGHLCAPKNVPILPINMGHFGFLIEVERAELPEKLADLFSGEYWLENRMMLQVEQWRDGKSLGTWQVLNEAMVGRGEVAHPIHLETELDGHLLTTYVADGLIVATPTGSTAYALAAGGPILPPELRNILVVPVAPHLSVDRAIVLAEGSDIRVNVQSDHRAVLSLDGRIPVNLKRDDSVRVRASEYSLNIVRFQGRGYFYSHLIGLMDQNPSAGVL